MLDGEHSPDQSPRAGLVPLSPERQRALLWALMLGNFVTGTGVLLPAGMLSELAVGLNVSLPLAGSLVVVSGALVAIGAPLIAAFTSTVDRRFLLVLAMAVYLLAHVIAALASSFEVVLGSRVLIAIAAAIFTPQAAATVGALLPPERRSSAITMIFIGWSLSTVGGLPLGGLIAHEYGWRTAFWLVAGMSLVSAIIIWLTVPSRVSIPPLNLASWKSVLTHPALMTVLLVTVLNGTGQFTFFTYLSPSLKTSLGADGPLLTVVLACYGVAATVGNVIASRFIAQLGAPRSAFVALLAMSAGLAVWGAGAQLLPIVLIGAIIWGLGTFATNSVQQARLASIGPSVTSASIALNTSAIYFGQAAGSALGGLMIGAGALAYLPWLGSGILLLAAAVSLVAMRYEHE